MRKKQDRRLGIETEATLRNVTADVSELFEHVETLGRGSFGKVERMIDRRSGKEVAVKIVNVPRTEDLTSLKKEIELLKKLRSPYIVNYGHSYFQKQNQAVVLVVLIFCICVTFSFHKRKQTKDKVVGKIKVYLYL